MSESSTSVSHENTSVNEGPSKMDMHRKFSKTRPAELDAMVQAFGIPIDLHLRDPPQDMTMDRLPQDAIGLYVQYFFEGGLNVPFSLFLLDVIKYFKVHIS